MMMKGTWVVAVGVTAGVAPGASAQGVTPEVLAPGVVSTSAIEYGAAFSPSGDTLYFTRRATFDEAPAIVWTTRADEGWQEPRPVSFGHSAGDEFPFITSDGRRLYFSSARPVRGVDQRDRNDLWLVERTGDGWSEARHLDGSLSTRDVDSHPVETPEGLFFHSRRAGGVGGVDAYFAPGESGAWGEPVPLPFNSTSVDGEVAPMKDGAGAVFYSDREGGAGRGDLYFVARRGSGWNEPVNLGAEINSQAWEWSPAFSPDGRTLIFGRLNESGDDSDLLVVRAWTPPEEGR